MNNKHIFIIIVLNLVLYAFSYSLNIERHVINIDYVLIFFLLIIADKFFPIKNRIFSLLYLFSLFVLIIIDMLSLVIQVFPFLYLEDFFYLMIFSLHGPRNYRNWFLTITILTIIILLVFSKIEYQKCELKNKVLAIFVFMLIGNSQSLIFIADQVSKYKKIEDEYYLNDNKQYDYLSKDIVSSTSSKSEKILFIINESWGSTYKEEIQKSILNPIYMNKDDYENISDGSFKFSGSTVSGELRELCQKQAVVMNITKIKDEEFNNCLPLKLRQQGYETYAMHGTNGDLYDRKRWYNLAGFTHILFKGSLERARNCQTFLGKCDYDLFESAVNILANNDKVFLYWLTLNTHSPYDDHLFIDGFNCEYFDIRGNSEACLNLKQQYQFFYRLSEYTKDDRMKGVEIYVVGDHAPPIISLKDDRNTFKDLQVGWLKFKIKGE